MAKFVQMSNVVVVFGVVNVVVSMTINHNKINMIIDQLLAIAIAVAIAWPRCAGRFVFADDSDASVAAMIIMMLMIIIIVFSVVVVVAQFTDVNALTGLGRPHGRRHRWAGGDGIAAAGGGCAG